MKFKPLTFNQPYVWRWTCPTPIGIFIIDTDSGCEILDLGCGYRPNYGCYLEQEVSLCPKNLIGVTHSVESAQKECQEYFEKELAPFIE